jgi:hypothetical protein
MLKSAGIALLAVACIFWSVAQLMSQDRENKQIETLSRNKLLEMQRNGVADSLGSGHPSVRELDARIRRGSVDAKNLQLSDAKPTNEMKIQNLIIVVQDLQRHVATLEVEVENLKRAQTTPASEGNGKQD